MILILDSHVTSKSAFGAAGTGLSLWAEPSGYRHRVAGNLGVVLGLNWFITTARVGWVELAVMTAVMVTITSAVTAAITAGYLGGVVASNTQYGCTESRHRLTTHRNTYHTYLGLQVSAGGGYGLGGQTMLFISRSGCG